MLFECFTESGVRVVARSQCHLSNVHRAHSQFSPCPFHPYPPNITRRAFPGKARENAVKVGDGEARNRRQHLTTQRFIQVGADVPLHLLDWLMVKLGVLPISNHTTIITL
jgi:hypothetical protein